jgi:hypothetical protein
MSQSRPNHANTHRLSEDASYGGADSRYVNATASNSYVGGAFHPHERYGNGQVIPHEQAHSGCSNPAHPPDANIVIPPKRSPIAQNQAFNTTAVEPPSSSSAKHNSTYRDSLALPYIQHFSFQLRPSMLSNYDPSSQVGAPILDTRINFQAKMLPRHGYAPPTVPVKHSTTGLAFSRRKATLPASFSVQARHHTSTSPLDGFLSDKVLNLPQTPLNRPLSLQQPTPAVTTTSLRVTSLAQAKARKSQRQFDWRPPSADPSVPQSGDARQHYVEVLRDAMIDISGAGEKTTGCPFARRWGSVKETRELYYDMEHIETVCWSLIDIAERYHVEGMSSLSIFDPESINTAKKCMNLTFGQRIDSMVQLLKSSKSKVDALMKNVDWELFVAVSTKQVKASRTNRTMNENRKVSIDTGNESLGKTKGKQSRKRKGSILPAEGVLGTSVHHNQDQPGGMAIASGLVYDHEVLPEASMNDKIGYDPYKSFYPLAESAALPDPHSTLPVYSSQKEPLQQHSNYGRATLRLSSSLPVPAIPRASYGSVPSENMPQPIVQEVTTTMSPLYEHSLEQKFGDDSVGELSQSRKRPRLQ